MTETIEFEHGLQFHRKADNPGGKPTYASILCKQSNTNIQRKLRKQDIAETNNNTSIALNLKNVITINQDPQPQQHQTPKMKTCKTQKKKLEEEIKRLKNEVASLKNIM